MRVKPFKIAHTLNFGAQQVLLLEDIKAGSIVKKVGYPELIQKLVMGLPLMANDLQSIDLYATIKPACKVLELHRFYWPVSYLTTFPVLTFPRIK